jgi:hypothetical protein
MPAAGDNQPTRDEGRRSGMWCKIHREADDAIWRIGITGRRVPQDYTRRRSHLRYNHYQSS